MEKRTGVSGRWPHETGHQERRRRHPKVALLVVFGAIVVGAAVGGAVSCGGDEEAAVPAAVTVEVTSTVQPSPEAEEEIPETVATAEATPPAGPTAEPSPEEEEYAGWLTYTNEVYDYEFRYPPEAEIAEAPMEAFGLPTEEFEAGATFEDVYDLYTGKICITVSYELGYINISAPPNEGFRYVICGRTGRAYEGPDREETLLIDGGTYTARGFEERGPGETLDYHNETLSLSLEDGTRIEFGAGPSDTATFEDYLRIRDVLLTIVRSYQALP